jgi:hypothetical protein
VNTRSVVRLGDLDGEGPTVFGRIGASFGRPGNGPGEFRNVIGLASAPGGNVWLVDGGNARYTIVRRDGSFESRASRIVR